MLATHHRHIQQRENRARSATEHGAQSQQWQGRLAQYATYHSSASSATGQVDSTNSYTYSLLRCKGWTRDSRFSHLRTDLQFQMITVLLQQRSIHSYSPFQIVQACPNSHVLQYQIPRETAQTKPAVHRVDFFHGKRQNWRCCDRCCVNFHLQAGLINVLQWSQYFHRLEQFPENSLRTETIVHVRLFDKKNNISQQPNGWKI